MHNKNKIFYEPAFEPNEFKAGGNKRSYQIKSLLEKHFFLIEPQKEFFFMPDRVVKYFYGLIILLKFNLPVKNLKNIAHTGYLYINLRTLIKKNSDTTLVIWESTKHQYLKFCIYKLFKIKTAYFPHNLESLVPEETSIIGKKKSPEWFNEELKIISKCDYTFTISQEEYWLLKLFNIKCNFFPYEVSQNQKNELTKVKIARSNITEKHYWFVYGSYFYEPIRKGIKEIIEVFLQKKLSSQIKIGGYGSKSILEQYPSLPDNIQILGEINRLELYEHLKNCKGVIINQKPSSGAPTKLVELKHASVPVIANELSLRSNGHISGFMPIINISELDDDMLKKKYLSSYEISNPPEYENSVIAIISSLLPN